MEKINAGEFQRIPNNLKDSETIARPSTSYWKDAFHRLVKNPTAVICAIFLLIIIVGSILVPWLSPYSFSEQHITHCYAKAGFVAEDGHVHILGTDDLGRDTLTRLFRGARISMFIAFSAVIVNVLIGVIYGGISGYAGGRTDNVMMRIVEIINGIPYLIIVILLMSIMQPGVGTIIVAYATVGWTGMARLVRGQVIALKEQEYVVAAKALGASPWRIILRHLVPNSLSVIIVNITLAIPSVIFTEAFLSFIGIGVAPPEASWGTLANAGARVFQQHPEQMFLPAALISLTMLAFNLLGDALRDAFDPKLRK